MCNIFFIVAYVTDHIIKDTTKDQKNESIILYEKVFRIHSTTSEAFKKSLTFYESHPDLLKPIADSLRVDEKKAQEYQNSIDKPVSDTTIRKARFTKPVKQ